MLAESNFYYIIKILFFKNNIIEYKFFNEFGNINDAIKNLNNFIISAKKKNLNYNYDKIKQLIDIINANNKITKVFNIPSLNDNMEIPVSVRDNLIRKKELLTSSIKLITNYDNTLSDEYYLNRGEYIFEIVNIYNSNNLNTKKLVELLKDLDDFTDKHLSIKFLIGLFNSNDIVNEIDISSYEIEDKLKDFFIIYNDNIEYWFNIDNNTQDKIFKFILFVLLLKTNNKKDKDIYKIRSVYDNDFRLLLEFLFLHI